jgi:hypothetical protein
MEPDPLSRLTVAEWIENTIKEGAFDGLQKKTCRRVGGSAAAAILVDPANARLTVHLGLRLAHQALESRTDLDQARRARGEAHFQTQRAVQIAADNEEVKKLRPKLSSC